ncbi:MAG: enoyl-CoA hydratase/isomerase family protein [Chloroflexi bacterium]|nr:enoyl-CoA hydratase/isomerase family protein [Chloroflexota bacterium]
MRTDFETVTFALADGIGRLTLNRPERLNGITNQMMRDLYEILAELASMPEARVVVLTGAGKGFCPGADLGHYSSGEAEKPLSPEHFQLTAMLHELPQVTVAAINGACAGAGLGWAAACDLRYAARSANFNSAFLGVGISGDMAGPWLLPRIIGAARAREVFLLHGKFGADEAERIGFVSKVFDDAVFRDEVDVIAGRLAASAPLAIRAMKQNFIAGENMSLREYIRVETERHQRTGASEDSRAAFKAFVEKRPAEFHGR